MTLIGSVGMASSVNTCTNRENRKAIRKVETPIVLEDMQPKTSKSKKTGLMVGIATALLAVGAVIVTRGKAKVAAAQKQKLLDSIPKDLQTKFDSLKKLEGKEFVDKAYSEMVDYMGLKGVAPKGIVQDGVDGIMTVNGGYNMINNTISYTSGFFNKLSKEQQLNMISHELKHCEQYTNMLRTEGITVEKYVSSTVERMIKEASKSPLNNTSFYNKYQKAVKQGVGEEFISKVRDKWTKDLAKDVQESYSDVLKMPKFKADSPEGIKALKDLNANSKYEGLDMLGFGSDAYKNNPLEVEAYAFGDKISDFFENFCKAHDIN